MTASLREAAQALLDSNAAERARCAAESVEVGTPPGSPPCEECQRLIAAEAPLRAALAQPDPGGWAEGVEAMRRAGMAALAYHPECVGELRALPVPPATTAPEAKPAESDGVIRNCGTCADWKGRPDGYGRCKPAGSTAYCTDSCEQWRAPVEPEETR